MATPHPHVHTKRAPLKARPRPDADAMKIAEEFMERFPKTLDYLGR